MKLKHCANIQFSSVDKHIFENEKQVLVCNYTDVYYEEVISNKEKFRKGSCSQREYNKFKIKNGDVIITKDSESADDIAIPAFVSKSFEDVVCGYYLALVRSISKPIKLTKQSLLLKNQLLYFKSIKLL